MKPQYKLPRYAENPGSKEAISRILHEKWSSEGTDGMVKHEYLTELAKDRGDLKSACDHMEHACMAAYRASPVPDTWNDKNGTVFKAITRGLAELAKETVDIEAACNHMKQASMAAYRMNPTPRTCMDENGHIITYDQRV